MTALGASDVFNLRSLLDQFDELSHSATKTTEEPSSLGSVVSSNRVPPSLRRLCFDLLVRHAPLCESLAGLPGPAVRLLLTLALRRHVVDRRFARLLAASGYCLDDAVDVSLALGFTRQGVKELRKRQCVKVLDLSGPVKAGDCRNLATLLPGLHCLRSLNLARYPHQLAMADAQAIAGLTGLESLDLSRTPITDEMLNSIVGGLTGLRSLNLHGCRVLKGEVPALAGLSLLKRLDVSFTHMAVNALPHIAQITSLRSLDLSWTPVMSVAQLQDLKSLEELNLSNTHASGGLAILSAMTNLQRLELSEDSSFERQLSMANPKLVFISVVGKRTARFVNEIKGLRPDLVVMAHSVPEEEIIKGMRSNKHDEFLVRQALSYLKIRTRFRQGQLSYKKRSVDASEMLKRVPTRQDHKRRQIERNSGYEVDESGVKIGTVTELRVPTGRVAEDLVDALYELLTPFSQNVKMLSKILELLRILSGADGYFALLSNPRWLCALTNLLWLHPNHVPIVRQSLRLLVNLGLASSASVHGPSLPQLLVDIVNLHPGDVCVVGQALQLAADIKGQALTCWLAPDALAALLRAMREHPRQLSVIEPALLILTLLENGGHGPELVAADAFHALAQAGANYPKAWDQSSEWTVESCVVVNTATLLDLLSGPAGIEVPPSSNTLQRVKLLWTALQQGPAAAVVHHHPTDKQQANRHRRQQRKVRKFGAQRLASKPTAANGADGSGPERNGQTIAQRVL